MAEAKGKQAEKVTIEKRESSAGEIGGDITMSEGVVATIAGLAARQIQGIHSLGKSRLISFGDSPTRGVDAEVGSREAALDLDVIIEYGVDLRKVAGELRKRISDEVDKMAGRQVVEVNINVVDVHLPEKEEPPPKRRVE